MIDGSEKRNRQLAFEFHNSRVFEKRSNTIYYMHELGTSENRNSRPVILTPSAKQRRNPCSGLPAVYPDLSTRHDWPVKKSLCFMCRDRQSG